MHKRALAKTAKIGRKANETRHQKNQKEAQEIGERLTE
jgi:hypothetical protein